MTINKSIAIIASAKMITPTVPIVSWRGFLGFVTDIIFQNVRGYQVQQLLEGSD